jgi:CRISPR-associated protein Cmr3
MALSCLELVPRDGLFCKDGAGWHTSASGRGRALGWPWPSTVLGALRGAHGRRLERERSAPLARQEWPTATEAVTLDAMLALRRSLWEPPTAAWRVWPAPTDALVNSDGTATPLIPRSWPGAGGGETELMYAAPADPPGKAAPATGFWPEESIGSWLSSWPPRVQRGQGGEQLGGLQLPRRLQVHVSIDPATLTGRDGELYSHEVLEVLERDGTEVWQWSIAVRTTLEQSCAGALATLGSDSRLVELRPLPAEVFDPPPRLLDAFAAGVAGLRLLLATPASFEAGWLPDGFAEQDGRITGRLPAIDGELQLLAALVPRPLAVSGWDIAKGQPKPTNRAVPAGAVYYFRRTTGASFTATEARALWLAALGGRTEQGFGRILPGIYHPPKEGA